MKRNRFMLTLSYESIIKLLGLPNDYELLSIAQLEAEKAMEKFSIIVAGEAGFKIPEGTPIPFLTIMELKERIERIEPVKLWWNGKHVATCLQGADETKG